jgi:peptide deformylase
MPVRPLVLFPSSSLNVPCEKVQDFGPALSALLADLADTLYAGPGVGLAAPQIGVSLQASLINIKRKSGPSAGYYIVNPILEGGEGIQIPREGCLSVPDLLANVRRFAKVTVRALNEKGEERLIRAEGFEALALQHEIDHLNGKLFLDRVANIRTDVFRRKTY